MKRKLISSGIRYGHPGPDAFSVREAAKNDPTGFMQKMQERIDAGNITLSNLPMKALFRDLYDVKVPVTMNIGGEYRALDAGAFPILTGSTIIKAINDRYLSVETIGENLVTEIEDNKKVTTIAAIHALDNNVEEVKELEEYPEISADEEKVEIRHKPNGRRLSISQAMIDENEVADIVERVNALADIASDWIEEQTLKRVTDYNGSASSAAEPYVYRPGGTGTSLFSATANTPGTRAPNGTCYQSNALADETDLDNARSRLRSMLNARGKRINIPWSEVGLLIPDALLGTALKNLNSEYVPGVENEVSNWGPRGKFNLPVGRLFSSPKLDDLSTSAWYMGAFKRQYRRKWKLRFEYVTLGMDTESYLRSRIAFQARIAWDCEVGAVDYVYVVQNLSGTTFPIDE